MATSGVSSNNSKVQLFFNHFEELPRELKINIFSFIPEDVPQIACVCKAWKTLVSDLRSWKVFAERAIGASIPEISGSDCKAFFTRRIGLTQSFQLNRPITIKQNFSLPVWHLTYVDETQTTYFIFLNHHEKWPITNKKILIWDPITEKEPQILFIHDQMINICEVAQIRFSPEKEKGIILSAFVTMDPNIPSFLLILKVKRSFKVLF